MSEQSQELVIPTTGEIVDLTDAPACISALDTMRDFESRIRELKSILTRAIVEEATKRGVRSIELENGDRADISAPTEMAYDAQELERRLREAGMPEDRIRDIVEETVSYKVNANEAKKAARANPVYEEIVDAVRTENAKAQYVTIRRRK